MRADTHHRHASVQEIAGKNADTHDSEHGNGENDPNIHMLSPNCLCAKGLCSPAVYSGSIPQRSPMTVSTSKEHQLSAQFAVV